jgi:F-box/WD-40 domain protein 7
VLSSSATLAVTVALMLTAGSYDKTVCVWDNEHLDWKAMLVGHTDSVRALAASGGHVFSGSDDTTIRVWDTSTLQCVSTLLGHSDNVRVMTVSNDNPSYLFSGSWDKTIHVWDIRCNHACVKVRARVI